MKSSVLKSIGLATLLATSTSAYSSISFNTPISFAQSGTVTLTLDYSAGGFDHILEMANSLGPIGTPLLALTENTGTPSADVLGYTPANIGDVVNLGSFTAGQELIFRLTNVESARLGTPGTISDQIFSGSSSHLNPTPDDFYTRINFIDANTIQVAWEDLFPISYLSSDPDFDFSDGGIDVAFTLTMTPVPLPSAVWIFGSALIGIVGVTCKRKTI